MTRLIKRSTVMGILAAVCATGMALGLTGCTSQTTIAELIAVVGTSVASVEAVQGNTTLVTQIQTDTAKATAQVLAWKSGTSTADVIAALNLVEDDLNLLPISSVDSAYISLAIGSVNEVLALIPASTTATVSYNAIPHRQVHLDKTPKTAAEYKKIWNGLASKDSKFSSTVLK